MTNKIEDITLQKQYETYVNSHEYTGQRPKTFDEWLSTRTNRKIAYIAKNKNSSMDWGVIETLRALADEIESGELGYNKCFICLLDDTDSDKYLNGFRMAQMKGTEAIALLEVSKSDILNVMLREG